MMFVSGSYMVTQHMPCIVYENHILGKKNDEERKDQNNRKHWKVNDSSVIPATSQQGE